MKRLFALLALISALTLHAADPLPVFNAMLTVGKDHRFVLIAAGGKASDFLQLGQSFDGYTLKAYDAKDGALDLERDGKITRIMLVADAAVTSAAAAPTPATLADATALLKKIHLDEILDRAIAQQLKVIGASVGNIGKNFPNAAPEDIAAFQQKIMDMVNGSLDPVKMKEAAAKIYSETFSKDELDQISGFYDTALGQMMLAKQPEVQQKMQAAMMQNAGQIGPTIQQMARDFALQQKAKMSGAPTPAAAPSTKP